MTRLRTRRGPGRGGKPAGDQLGLWDEEIVFADDPPSPQPAPPAVPRPAPAPATVTPGPDSGLLSDAQGPSGAVARIEANLTALDTLRAIQAADRPATGEERAALSRWSGWGAVPELFDERPRRHGPDYSQYRKQLQAILTDAEYRAARRTVLNAHYTDPAIVTAMWGLAAHLGFDGGQVLEPGCGSGNFIAVAPSGAQVTGIELDTVTAGIAAVLHPCAQVIPLGFEQARIREDSFDLVIGNVPFGDSKPRDRQYNPGGKLSLHNYVLAKALHLLRPGGLLIAVTSSWTMDAEASASREVLAGLGDLIGAVRLPAGAHQRTAGTKVVTDILVMRRRIPGTTPAGEDWTRSCRTTLDGWEFPLNEYFDHRRARILGTLAGVKGRFGGEMTVHGPTDPDTLTGRLQHAFSAITETAADLDLTYVPAEVLAPASVTSDEDRRNTGYITAHPDGTFTITEHGQQVPLAVPATQATELRHQLAMRDTARDLLAAQAADATDTPAILMARARLAGLYRDYQTRYGPLNRFTRRRTGRYHPTGELDDRGQPVMEEGFARVRPPVMRLLRLDPFYPLVLSLEDFEDATQQADPAPIQTRRTLSPRTFPQTAADPASALMLCLDMTGAVRLDVIARLLSLPGETEARDALGTLVFTDPADGRVIPRAEYLSGNVRTKLAAAELAARDNPNLRVNVEALREVQPIPLTPEEITARLGATWIPPSCFQQFLREILDDRRLTVEHGGGQIWTVTGDQHTVRATSTWGTERYSAPRLAQAIMEQRPIQVKDLVSSNPDVYVLNPDATAAAAGKAEEMRAAFAEWAWDDPDRARQLAAIYNEKFNNLVLRNYEGVKLLLPGMSEDFHPHPHQYEGIARQLLEPATGLFWVVGAGKTAAMVGGTMENRRLGRVRKPMIVVPNNLLEQFAADWLKCYPQAKVLVCYKEDLERSRRRRFAARCATGDWDAVIIAQSSFELLAMSPEWQRRYLNRELAMMAEWLGTARRNGRRDSVKKLEAALARAEARIAKKLDGVKDPGLTFEELGIDHLTVDEADMFKNLRVSSRIQDAAIDGSNKATDLHMKITWLRDRYARGPVFATGTPLANKIPEIFVMMQYLRPDLLEEQGVQVFDQWAAIYGELVTRVELAIEGGGVFRTATRLAEFDNVPEMKRMLHIPGDVRLNSDLNLPVPLIAEDDRGRRRPRIVAVPACDSQTGYIQELGQRAEDIHQRKVKPDEDNMLKLSGDGRKCALDARMVGLPQDTPGKIDAAAREIHRIWAAHRDDPAPATQPGKPPGALQLVFCDFGTPGGATWDAYAELRRLLYELGLPEGSVRFMHEAKDDRAKAALQRACWFGSVAVLVGSTTLMGAGINVQARCSALHDLDAPWRPRDIEQRLGRIIRQRNNYDEVEVIRYVTEGSFDGFMWQTLERKAVFIGQVMSKSFDVRSIKALSDDAMSYAEVKAITTGNPWLLAKAEADQVLTALERAERAHLRTQARLADEINWQRQRIAGLTTLAEDITHAITVRVPTRGDQFTMTVDGTEYVKRDEAGEAMLALVRAELPFIRDDDVRTVRPARLGGFDVVVRITDIGGRHLTVTTSLDGVPESGRQYTGRDIETLAGRWVVQQLEDRIAGLEGDLEEAHRKTELAEREITHARENLGVPFGKTAELAAARAEVTRIITEMGKLAAETRTKTPAADGAETPPAALPRRRLPATVEPVTLALLRECVTNGRLLRLGRTVPRGQYLAVNKVLEAAGGEWDKRNQAHVFPGDAAEVLTRILTHYAPADAAIERIAA
jgi:N12 class adenine-specific DNA methylase